MSSSPNSPFSSHIRRFSSSRSSTPVKVYSVDSGSELDENLGADYGHSQSEEPSTMTTTEELSIMIESHPAAACHEKLQDEVKAYDEQLAHMRQRIMQCQKAQQGEMQSVSSQSQRRQSQLSLLIWKEKRDLAESLAAVRDRHQYEIDALHRKTKQLEKKRRLSTWVTSPLRRIPLEILSLIIAECVSQHRMSPWVLVHVCKSWSKAAFSTSRIWAEVHLSSDGGGFDTGGPPQQVWSLGSLRKALYRCGATAPLSISISDVDGTIETANLVTNFLSSPSYLSRCVSLHLSHLSFYHHHPANSEQQARLAMYKNLAISPLSRLQYLQIDGDWSCDEGLVTLHRALASATKTLTHVVVQRKQYLISEILRVCHKFPSLSTVDFTFKKGFHGSSRIGATVYKTCGIKEVTMRDYYGTHTDDLSQFSIFPHVEKLTLRDCVDQRLYGRTLSSIVSLTICDTESLDLRFTNATTFPLLRDFSYTSDLWKRLPFMDCPRLEHLDLRVYVSFYRHPDWWKRRIETLIVPSPLSMSPKVLNIQYHGKEEDFVQVASRLGDLEELTITSDIISPFSSTGILAALVENSHWPKLRKIELRGGESDESYDRAERGLNRVEKEDRLVAVSERIKADRPDLQLATSWVRCQRGRGRRYYDSL